MIDHMCFRCKHFKQYQPLTFTQPGECDWTEKEQWPHWLDFAVNTMRGDYYAPKRRVYRAHPPKYCAAFDEVVQAQPEAS